MPEPTFHVKQVRSAAEALGLELDEGQVRALLRYAELLGTRAVEIGAVSERDRGRVLERHVLDSLRAAPHVSETDRTTYDLGSGAGLPGVPTAVACPWCTVVLIESRHWRAAFLEMAVEELSLNARVDRARVETATGPADVVTARAFAPLEKTWRLAEPLLRPGGRLIFFAGAGLEDPAGEARRVAPHADVDVVPNVLAPGGPLVIMRRP